MIKKIFNGQYLRRLDNIIQWQEKDVFKHESVAGHSYKVSVFVRILLEDIFGNSSDVNVLQYKLNCVTHALFHDWDESLILRDLSHELKYNKFNGDKIREVIDEFVDHAVFVEFGNETDTAKMLNENIGSVDPGVKLLVKYCDWLALLFFCKRELDLHNDALQVNYDYCLKSIHTAGAKLADYLEQNFSQSYISTDNIIK